MTNLGLWLSAMIPTLVGKVLAALGFGLITLTGLETVTDILLSQVTSSVGGIPTDILQLLNLAGMSTGLNMLLGAMAARFALYMLTTSTRLVGQQLRLFP